MRLYEQLYETLRAIDIVYRINARGHKVLRYLENRWARGTCDLDLRSRIV